MSFWLGPPETPSAKTNLLWGEGVGVGGQGGGVKK